MAPRKSLPASTSTPKRSSLPTRSNTSVKRGTNTRQASSTPIRSKRTRGVETAEQDDTAKVEQDDEVEKGTAEASGTAQDGGQMTLDPEKEIEAWQEFAADHYEMVEQLPLELHRNFRLLRELDDVSMNLGQELQKVIRAYISRRLGTVTQKADVKISPEAEHLGTEEPNEEEVDQVVNAAEELDGTPVSDGQGGLVVPAEDANGGEEVGEPMEARRAFPHDADDADGDVHMDEEEGNTELKVNDGAVEDDQTPRGEIDGDRQDETPAGQEGQQPRGRASVMLPDIGRLTREMLRNGEEKVALAVGAYNAIDRHIRALDSALSSHEASILLGLRADTNPSAAVEPVEQVVDPAFAGEDGEEVTIGMGGGGARKKKGKKGKRGKKIDEVADATQQAQVAQVPGALLDLDIDPNEPRYCYCNQVSYGQMVGCENDECPLEWFHLACIGLTTPPTGKWYCNICKPKDADKGRGAAGSGQKKHRKGGKGWSRR